MQRFLDVEFELPEELLNQYGDGNDKFGFNGLGLITFLRSYALPKDDGNMETWKDCVQRVTEQTYSIQKWHCLENNRPWSDTKAQRSAKEFFDRMFEMKWLPPGRGLSVMGTSLVSDTKGVEALQNCASVTTENNFISAVEWAMVQLMMGVGVGYDNRAKDDGIKVLHLERDCNTYVIQDTRQDWAYSVRLLLEYYLGYHKDGTNKFDYSLIRKKGSMISTFKREASGAEPLKLLHKRINELCRSYIGKKIDSRFITDVFNQIGACVVSGNIRRSAEISLSDSNDTEFLSLKDYTLPQNKSRQEWGWNSNNTVYFNTPVDSFNNIIENLYETGEPGALYLDNFKYGRMGELNFDKGRLVNP